MTDAAAALRALALEHHEYPNDRFDGRGIVVCAGGARMFTCAWVALSVLRRSLGCRLPVELWHLGEAELGLSEAALLAELDVDTVDALALRERQPARVLGGWELKSYALVNSRFREVLMLDADNVPIRDPSFLFDEPAYRDTGAVFWPDANWLAADSEIWALCGVRPRNEPAWESGQLVVDKARCWAPLALVRHMNDHSELFYRHLHGDKDTFHLAWRMLERPCAMPAKRPRVLDYGLLQHDLDGEPLFQHRNQAKWALRGTNVIGPSFRHADACERALRELEQRWSGRISVLPERSASDLEAEVEIATARLFRCEREASDETVLELLPGNNVGDGRRDSWLRWYVRDGQLVLSGVPGETALLSRAGDGRWRGRSLERGSQALLLEPLVSAVGDPIAAVTAALLHRVDDGGLDRGRAVEALLALGSITEMGPVLARARSQRPPDSAATAVIEEVRWRLGRRDPSLRVRDGGDRRRYVAG